MKKIVFLLFLLSLISATSVSASTTTTYDFGSYEFQLTYMSDDEGNKGYAVNKLGENPFSTTIINNNQWISINGITEINDFHVFYGFTHIIGQTTFYEGYLLVLNSIGEVVYEKTIDTGLLEEIKGIYEIDQTIMMQLTCYSVEDRDEYVYEKTRFITLNHEYEELDYLEFYEEIFATSTTDYFLLYNLDYDDFYDGAFTASLDIINDYDPLMIETNTIYSDTVFIPFINQAVLNNEVIENGILIEYPGNYELEYNDYTYTFSIEPLISGIENGGIYNDSVTPRVSAGNVYLNNDLFVSGTTVDKPGNYILEVIGIGGYKEQIEFTITSDIDGVLHNQTYQEPVELTFNGNGYLNNTHITSPFTIEDDGDYIFKIKGENDYTETYFFTIENEIEEEASLIHFIQQYDIIFLGITVISGLLILKKK